MPADQTSFVRAGGREMPVGSVGFNITPNAGAAEDVADGRTYHSLGLWVDPADDQFPRLVMTDVDLYVEGDVLEALDGLRLRQDAEGGDFGPVTLPWIRPGSMTGMAEIVYEPASREERGNWDPDARKYLGGELRLEIDRVGDRWRIEVSASSDDETGNRPTLHAVFYSELEVFESPEDYDD